MLYLYGRRSRPQTRPDYRGRRQARPGAWSLSKWIPRKGAADGKSYAYQKWPFTGEVTKSLSYTFFSLQFNYLHINSCWHIFFSVFLFVDYCNIVQQYKWIFVLVNSTEVFCVRVSCYHHEVTMGSGWNNRDNVVSFLLPRNLLID